jgi:hypothetical protein
MKKNLKFNAIAQNLCATIILNLFLLFGITLLAGDCSSKSLSTRTSPEFALKKINFNINDIDEKGLVGPADGKRLVAYKFSIPLKRARQKEVLAIDSSVKFFKSSTAHQYDCIGEGGTRDVLLKLANLDYIRRIDPFYGE